MVLENYASEEVLPSADFLSLDGGLEQIKRKERVCYSHARRVLLVLYILQITRLSGVYCILM